MNAKCRMQNAEFRNAYALIVNGKWQMVNGKFRGEADCSSLHEVQHIEFEHSENISSASAHIEPQGISTVDMFILR